MRSVRRRAAKKNVQMQMDDDHARGADDGWTIVAGWDGWGAAELRSLHLRPSVDRDDYCISFLARQNWQNALEMDACMELCIIVINKK